MEQWLYDVQNGPWLLVLDNADNASVFFDAEDGFNNTRSTTANAGRGRGLWTYLPQSSHGSILITTRNKEVARKLTGNHKNIIEVPTMDKDHALALLAKKAGRQPDMDNSAALVKALEYMPLAISQAAAYIQQQAPRTSIGQHLNEFRKSERCKLRLLSRDEESLWRDHSASNSVILTWQISFDSVRSEQPSAADLLSLMSFFDHQEIAERLLRPLDNSQDSNANIWEGNVSEDRQNEDDNNSDASSANDPSEDLAAQTFESELTMLRNYCLISLNKTGDVFQMHSLVQLAIKQWLSKDGRAERFKEQFISRIAREFPTGDYRNWGTC